MHSKSDDIGIMINYKTDKVTEDFLESPSSRYQIGLEESMRGSDFIFNCVNLLHYKCHKINLNRGKTNINSPF